MDLFKKTTTAKRDGKFDDERHSNNLKTIKVSRANKFYFWNVYGIMNISGLLQS